MSARGDWHKLLAEAIGRGWVEVRDRRHRVLVWKSGQRLVLPKSTSDVRAIRNARARMRRIEEGRYSGQK